MFKRLIGTKRCVVMYNGFYEWKKEGTGKVPHYIHLKDDEPIFMAGLYDKWDGALVVFCLHRRGWASTSCRRSLQAHAMARK